MISRAFWSIGTLDGANVEIREQVGDENMFLFGMNADEVEALWRRGYSPREFLTPELERILNMLTSGVLGQRFDDIYASLLTNRFGTAAARDDRPPAGCAAAAPAPQRGCL